jgi:hypothetical protein
MLVYFGKKITAVSQIFFFWINFAILSSILIQFCKKKLLVPDLQI